MTRQIIAELIVKLIQRDVDDELRETEGKNRGPRLDSFNVRVGANMGDPYCASGAWCAIDEACRSLGLKNPLDPTAWSQSFRDPEYIPEDYMREDGALGEIGDAGVFQVLTNPDSGHLVTLSQGQSPLDENTFKTVEYNTDGSGSQDGDGAYNMVRSTLGFDDKKFVCFTDVPQYIYDYNHLGE